ncbi:ArsR/SmtB family transcription factor [Zavarzinia sp. CC-PAN008]|uniref:ArsR/SmtB family transcription factor n=1 Tax=Zavarzinia sp. CC-PAN008 TaxID=3243332 RepID=UPI003F7489A5
MVDPDGHDPRDAHRPPDGASLDGVLAGLRAAGEPTRLRLLALLARAELTVTELCQIVGQSQPRVSRHLKLMTEAGLIERIREGTWVFCRLGERGGAASLARQIARALPEDELLLAGDRSRLESVVATRAEAAAAYFRANAANWRRMRALHVDEAVVEQALAELVGRKPLGDLLDIGTGTGRMLELFGGQASRAVGIDLSHDMLAVARVNLARAGLSRAQVRHGDMYRLNAGDEAFDLILVHQVLHYATDPASAIAEAARVLRPGGRLVVVDFAPHGEEFLRQDHAHRRLGFAPEEVAGWCRAAGLEAGLWRELPGEPLTVSIWLARKAQIVEGTLPAEKRPLEKRA